MNASTDLAPLERPTLPADAPVVARASTAAPAAAPASAANPRISEFLAFKLGGEEYGIDILRVQEIRSYEQPTRIASAPRHILGVVNLRGLVVPIVDLRLSLNLDQAQYNGNTVVIVLNIAARVVGIVVDAVSDVITLTPEQMRPVPALSAGIATEHLLAIGAVEGRMLILMDIEKLMTSPAMGLIENLH